MILFLCYLALVGIMTTVDYLRFQTKVGLVRCFLLGLFSPLYIVNVLVGVILSFAGILYLTKVGYIDLDSLQKAKDDSDSSNSEDDKNLQ